MTTCHIKSEDGDTMPSQTFLNLDSSKQKKLLDAWLALHEDELKASWYSYNNDGEVIKIRGLE